MKVEACVCETTADDDNRGPSQGRRCDEPRRVFFLRCPSARAASVDKDRAAFVADSGGQARCVWVLRRGDGDMFLFPAPRKGHGARMCAPLSGCTARDSHPAVDGKNNERAGASCEYRYYDDGKTAEPAQQTGMDGDTCGEEVCVCSRGGMPGQRRIGGEAERLARGGNSGRHRR